MKLIAVILAVASMQLLAADKSTSGISFVGVLTSGGVTHVILIEEKYGKSSGWIRIGQDFAGFTVKTYDSHGEVLTLSNGRVEFAVGLARDAKIKPGLALVRIGNREYRIYAEKSETKDGTVSYFGNVTGLSDGMHFSCDKGVMDEKRGTLSLFGNVVIQSGSSIARGEQFVLHDGPKLDKPNKAPEPTPGSVTPRATSSRLR